MRLLYTKDRGTDRAYFLDTLLQIRALVGKIGALDARSSHSQVRAKALERTKPIIGSALLSRNWDTALLAIFGRQGKDATRLHVIQSSTAA